MQTVSNPSYFLVSPIKPEPHSILAISCKGRAEVILLICTDPPSIQQNPRLTEDGAAVPGSSSSIGRALDSVGGDKREWLHQIGMRMWWQIHFWVSLGWCKLQAFSNRSSFPCCSALNATILKIQYFTALQILSQKDISSLWIIKLYLPSDHGFNVDGILLAFISLVKAERKFSCQAFSACPLPTYLTCLPRALLYHSAWFILPTGWKMTEPQSQAFLAEVTFLVNDHNASGIYTTAFWKGNKWCSAVKQLFFPALKKDGQLPFTSWLPKYFYLESKHLLLLYCLILWST